MGIMCVVHGLNETDLDKLEGNEENVEDFFENAEDGIDLDKAWHAIHFLLTGSAWEGTQPLNFIVAGGRQLGDPDDWDARFFSPSEVRAIREALAPLSATDLLDSFVPEAFTAADIYPEIWHRAEERQVHKEYIAESFKQLKSYVDSLASQGKAMIVSVG